MCDEYKGNHPITVLTPFQSIKRSNTFANFTHGYFEHMDLADLSPLKKWDLFSHSYELQLHPDVGGSRGHNGKLLLVYGDFCKSCWGKFFVLFPCVSNHSLRHHYSNCKNCILRDGSCWV